MEQYYSLALQNAIELFNANRHWILPLALVVVIGALAESIWICGEKN